MKKIKNNYIQIKTEDGWIQEHRKIVEDFLKRKLTSKEVVHHINSNRKDNSLNNLMIFKNQKEHSSFHIYFTKYGFNNTVRRKIRNRWNL